MVFGFFLLALGAGVLLALFWPPRGGPGQPGAEIVPESGGPPESPPPEEPQAPSPPAETPPPDTSPLSPVRREGNRFFFALPPGEFTLVGEFSAPCWLRVEADGRRVFEGTLPAGGRGEWKAGRRLTVRVGNPPGASFRVGERPLSLPPEKRPVDLELATE